MNEAVFNALLELVCYALTGLLCRQAFRIKQLRVPAVLLLIGAILSAVVPLQILAKNLSLLSVSPVYLPTYQAINRAIRCVSESFYCGGWLCLLGVAVYWRCFGKGGTFSPQTYR